MDFRVLGPLEVAGNGAASPFRGQRERALLTALVLHVGEVVSTDRLIVAVWGDRPPRTAAKNVQNQVLRLRKALGASVIETRAPGYRLVVDASAIDVRQFEDLVALGRTASVNGTPDRAAAALRDALALWRGSPFEDLGGCEPAEIEAARLRELRRIASEELMDAELGNRVASEPVRIRIGLHVGEPVRDEGDFFGRSVVIASRLCDAAAPVQVFASDLVRKRVGWHRTSRDDGQDSDGPRRQAPSGSLRPNGGCRVSVRARPTDRYKDSPHGTSAGIVGSDLTRAPTRTLTSVPTNMVDPISAHAILAAGSGVHEYVLAGSPQWPGHVATHG